MAPTTFGEYLDRIGGTSMLRIVHMVLNGIAAAAGVFLIVMGVTNLFDMFKIFGGASLPISSIVLGSLVVLITTVGIVGSIKRSQQMFGTYSGLLTLLVLVQLVVLLVLWLRPHDVEARFSDVWEGLYKNDQDTIRSIEKDLKCCGFQSPVDMAVPDNCATKKHYGFSVGCVGPLEYQWRQRRCSALWAGFTMVGAQIVALLMGAELGRRYRLAREGYQRVPGREGSPLLRTNA
ncbi:hypothetical protein GGI04_000689 [Coemansia thaxteri]|uniref:Tetraspanin n=1 Tax=Coemansia thaxteri TaxID=2663907 RepID=A0A9W8BGI2_9FUNG|nr:hypothetical protein H4R26_001448 [Coemansia thaxteri]KAJ2009129.1 hypothetical protein GGI04_000689 [Coemansia thaxteri]KAJ2473713.1 hypothetical protein GGI02_000639 [Coemansia sp. RSA 2322]KAJ2486755.1 hypothetical protein EV174_000915 [Coemansia sp. RSA 2320]